MPHPPLDPAVERFLAEYRDRRHALMDWRLGYSAVERELGTRGPGKDEAGPPLAGRNVLDYGCGDGRFTRLLRDRGARLIGVDVSADAIARARAGNCRNIDYQVIESGQLEVLPPGWADLAVSTFVLCCLRTVDQIAAVLRAIGERLKPAGRLVVSEPHPDAVGREFYSMRRTPRGRLTSGTPLDVFLPRTGETLHDFWHSRADYAHAFAAAGFTIDQTYEPTMPPDPAEPHWQAERDHPPFLIFRARK